MIRFLRLAALIILCATPLFAQDIVGDWQGTLKTDAAQLRLIVEVAKREDGRLRCTIYYIDQGVQFDASTVTFDNGHLVFKLDRTGGTFDGQLSADGTSFSGSFSKIG